MIRFVLTDGSDPDFAALCAELDAHLNELAGGEENRAAYIPLNRSDDVRTVVLAYEGEQPAGGGGLRRLDAGCAEVKRLFVRPACRGRGIAAQVMALLEREARAQGCRRLVLETGETLAAAMALYRKLGYRVIPNYGPYRGMDDSICMQKDL